jgi:pimeloyl-ACP methyl ester carboxylesterase
VEKRTIDCGDVGLAILEAGEGGRPLLLVHGFAGSKEDFADEVDRLAAQGRWVVAPDHRGHGASSQPDDEAAYGLATYAADMFALADCLGWDSFDLLGHSMGGMVAQVMVLDRPERIDRLVLMDTCHGFIEGVDRDILLLGIEITRTEGLKVVQDVLKLAAKPEDQVAHLRVCAERPGYAEWSDSKMLACSPAMYAAMLAEFRSLEDRLDDLAAVTNPTLVVVGELDRDFVGPSRRMADRIPGAELVVIEQAGHSPQFEGTAAWREAIDRFLAA